MWVKQLMIAVLFTACFYVLGLIPSIKIPFTSVPLVLQNMGVFLVGSILGPLGIVSVLLFLGLTAMGVPILAGGQGGIAVFLGANAGYLIGYAVATLLIGLLVYGYWSHISFAKFVGINFLGMLVIHVCGVPWLMWKTEMNFTTTLITTRILIPGDVIKILLSSYIATHFKKYHPVIQKTEILDETL